jgi:hypothetical protein
LATYHAVAATGQAILRLLQDAYPRNELGAADFELYQVSSFQSPMSDGISLFLYRVTVNRTHRTVPARPAANGRRTTAPMAVDLSYLLTAWGKTAAKQQLLLAWAMRVLEDSSILPVGLLNDAAAVPDVFGPQETVELTAEPLSLQDISNLWDLLKPNIPLSAAYLARLIEIESLRDAAEFPVVQTRVVNMGGEVA